jgi:hypothetical protein
VPGDGRDDGDACPQGPSPPTGAGSERPDPLVLPTEQTGRLPCRTSAEAAA